MIRDDFNVARGLPRDVAMWKKGNREVYKHGVERKMYKHFVPEGMEEKEKEKEKEKKRARERGVKEKGVKKTVTVEKGSVEKGTVEKGTVGKWRWKS